MRMKEDGPFGLIEFPHEYGGFGDPSAHGVIGWCVEELRSRVMSVLWA